MDEPSSGQRSAQIGLFGRDGEILASEPDVSVYGRLIDDPSACGFPPKPLRQTQRLSVDRKRPPTSFWVKGGEDVWQTVRNYLIAGDDNFLVVASDVDEEKFRLQALALFETQAWAFCRSSVRVDRLEDGWRVVEFQRIKGDSVCFNDVFLLTCKALRRAGLTVCNSDRQPKKTEEDPEPFPEEAGDIDQDSGELTKAIKQLIKMVQRPSMRGEAAAGLADASRHYAQQIAAQEELYAGMLQLLGLTAPEVAYPVAVFLERVARTEHGRAKMTAALEGGQSVLATVQCLLADGATNAKVRTKLQDVVAALTS